MSSRVVCLAALLFAAGCSRPDNASGAGGVTAGEARALDDAAQMVESQQVPPDAMPSPQSPPPAKAPAAQPSAKPSAKPAG